MRLVRFLAAGIDHQHQMIADIAHHQVVEDAAAVLGEQRIAHPPDGETLDVRGDDALERRAGVMARLGGEAKLAHVGYVEQARLGTDLEMLGDDAARVLHRHVIAGKGNHARAQLQVQLVERGLPQGFGIHGVLRRGRRCAAGPVLHRSSNAPSVVEPERLTLARLGCGLGFPLR